tara:strand:+ start:464 stop:700 length:237 start_codon:yes stop_codon:yes gene_type:complete
MDWLKQFTNSIKSLSPTIKKPEDNIERELLDSADVDTKVNIHTLYKHRWVWYHLILCVQMILTNILLIGILIILAIKL